MPMFHDSISIVMWPHTLFSFIPLPWLPLRQDLVWLRLALNSFPSKAALNADPFHSFPSTGMLSFFFFFFFFKDICWVRIKAGQKPQSRASSRVSGQKGCFGWKLWDRVNYPGLQRNSAESLYFTCWLYLASFPLHPGLLPSCYPFLESKIFIKFSQNQSMAKWGSLKYFIWHAPPNPTSTPISLFPFHRESQAVWEERPPTLSLPLRRFPTPFPRLGLPRISPRRTHPGSQTTQGNTPQHAASPLPHPQKEKLKTPVPRADQTPWVCPGIWHEI